MDGLVHFHQLVIVATSECTVAFAWMYEMSSQNAHALKSHELLYNLESGNFFLFKLKCASNDDNAFAANGFFNLLCIQHACSRCRMHNSVGWQTCAPRQKHCRHTMVSKALNNSNCKVLRQTSVCDELW